MDPWTEQGACPRHYATEYSYSYYQFLFQFFLSVLVWINKMMHWIYVLNIVSFAILLNNYI